MVLFTILHGRIAAGLSHGLSFSGRRFRLFSQSRRLSLGVLFNKMVSAGDRAPPVSTSNSCRLRKPE